MITFITGSFTCSDPDIVADAVRECGFPVTSVLLGGEKGVGQLAERYARSRGLARTVVRPDWVTHGRDASPIRDDRVLEQAEALIVISPAGLPEASELLAKAKLLGKHVFEYEGSEGQSPSRRPDRPAAYGMAV